MLDGGVAVADDVLGVWLLMMCGSRYDPNMSVVDNIDLPPSLMSRFDLIYLVLDKPDPVSDRRLAKHLLSMYSERGFLPSAVRPILASRITQLFLLLLQETGTQFSSKELNEYISYARLNIRPKISEEATHELVSGYTQMRRSSGNKKVCEAGCCV